jgi:predicted enzyme related to lactoylglutathione lyase
MAKIRHLAIRTEDPGKLASFYMDVFEMQILHKSKEEGGTVFLTDGYFNLAIIPNKEQNATNGLYHFGFEVEDGEAIVEKMKKINPNKLPKPRPTDVPMPRRVGRIRMATISTSRSMAFWMCNRLVKESRAKRSI